MTTHKLTVADPYVSTSAPGMVSDVPGWVLAGLDGRMLAIAVANQKQTDLDTDVLRTAARLFNMYDDVDDVACKKIAAELHRFWATQKEELQHASMSDAGTAARVAAAQGHSLRDVTHHLMGAHGMNHEAAAMLATEKASEVAAERTAVKREIDAAISAVRITDDELALLPSIKETAVETADRLLRTTERGLTSRLQAYEAALKEREFEQGEFANLKLRKAMTNECMRRASEQNISPGQAARQMRDAGWPLPQKNQRVVSLDDRVRGWRIARRVEAVQMEKERESQEAARPKTGVYWK